LFLGAGSAAAQIVITNVMAVNVTPASFSVAAIVSPAITPAMTASISIFSDPGGVTNLSGQVGVEYYPLHTGDPTLTNAYDRLLDLTALRQKTMSLGLFQARVTGCAPGTTYYYQLQVSNTNGQAATWPASGPLPAASTALETSFVLQSEQLVITLDDASPAGAIITLSNTNTPSVLAAVVGDGAATNQAFFSVADLIAAAGGTNYLAAGNQEYTATVLGPSGHGQSQTYSLVFPTNFLIGSATSGTLGGGPPVMLSIGSDAVLAGGMGVIPIQLNAGTSLTNVQFVLNLPTEEFTTFFVEDDPSLVGSTLFRFLSPTSLQIGFTAVAGQTFLGSEQIGQLSFLTVSNQNSSFVQLAPQSLQGFNADGSSPANFQAAAGRLVIIGPQPLLEATRTTHGARNLVLYGIPGDSYQVQYSVDLAHPDVWTNLVRVAMTNLSAEISNLDRRQPAIFYRAYEFTAATPILDVAIVPPGANETLVLYGTPGQAYEVDYTTNLGSTWTLLERIPLANPFQLITGLSSSNQAVFYRYGSLNADPPILEAYLSGQSPSLLAYGLARTNYTLQSATNLSGTVAWHPELSYTLTNSYLWITNVGRGAPDVFYRLKRP
ncbi:MAG TPA: hypothetical protein VN765_05290, partial [Candidatus Acidoferrum sp.]|nr:hypothetical protein [Candidatus Acidoferrum sp.]